MKASRLYAFLKKLVFILNEGGLCICINCAETSIFNGEEEKRGWENFSQKSIVFLNKKLGYNAKNKFLFKKNYKIAYGIIAILRAVC